MNRINNIIKILSPILFVIVILQFIIILYISRRINYENIEIKGSIPYCSDNCFPFRVKAVSSSYKDFELEPSYTYGGGALAQICEDLVEFDKCTDLDITKLPGFKLVDGDDNEKFPIYTYINKYATSEVNNKIYFLYRVLSDGPSKTDGVYDDPLIVVSFNTKTREISLEGKLSVTGINVKKMFVSPDGTNLLIVNENNLKYFPNVSYSNILLFNLKDKTTKIYENAEKGQILNFITWIDDKHFIYSSDIYTSDMYSKGNNKKVIFKFGKIK